KTANYTFASPLTMGAILAGAKENEIKKLFNYGMRLGRAFQIKDDLIGTFGRESETGKSNFTDFQEAKKTILIWRAYNKSGAKDKKIIKEMFTGSPARREGLKDMRRVIKDSGALDYAKSQISGLIKQAQNSIGALKMRSAYRKTLDEFSRKILNVKS
ncbi:MAG: polyprenyl synthetase family protein, partial [Candidatus Omnitrophota bacterium]|nr:polyprenyl synthetase family protein [Candidatus Omnitrophota bacterium]